MRTFFYVYIRLKISSLEKGGIEMLSDMIKGAQKADEDDMMGLIHKFDPLFRKYAVKLHYEDAYEDIILYFIELIKFMNLNRLNSQKDEVIISYINTSVINFYKKRVRQLIEAKKEVVLSDLTQEQAFYVEVQSAKTDKANVFIEFGIRELLSAKEYQIIYLVYIEGYSTAEIARRLHRSRQAVNQLKQRALRKIKRVFTV